MSHFIFTLVIFAIVAAFKVASTATSQSGNGEADKPASNRPYRKGAETEEERMRRFMEAVGLPPGASPPSPVRPRAGTEQKPMLSVPPPDVSAGMPGRLRRVAPAQTGNAPAGRPQAPARRGPARSSGPLPAPARASRAAPVVEFPAPPESPIEARSAPPVQTYIAPVAATLVAPPPYPTAALLARLRDPASLREAIVLREVLGPPKALQSGLGDYSASAISGPR